MMLFYCVANMPEECFENFYMALNKATLPLLIKLINWVSKTLTENKNYLAGLNIFKGKVTVKVF